MGDDPPVLDFAIVGGGVAGLYSAWRIASTSPDVINRLIGKPSGVPSLKLFEATTRVGGRLLTVRMPGTTFLAELGGMRYTTSHILLRDFVRSFRLPTKPFRFVDRLMYLRGRHLKAGSVLRGSCESCDAPRGMPYRLEPDEPDTPVQLTRRAIVDALKSVEFDWPAVASQEGTTRELVLAAAILSGLAEDGSSLTKLTLSCNQWALLKRYGMLQGRPLYDLGFWNLLQYFLSSEGFLMVHDALGYESIFANWNAAEAIPWFLADFGVDYFTLERGMDDVPRTLAALLEKSMVEKSKGSEWLQEKYELKKIEWRQKDRDAPFLLYFKGLASPLSARFVILALPKEAMKEVEISLVYSSAGASDPVEEFRTKLEESVTAHPLFKMFLAYDRAWWLENRGLGAKSGRATTDLPIRQVYYYEPVKANEQKDEVPGVVMACYSDEHYVDFWKPMIRKFSRKSPKREPAPYTRPEDQFDELDTDIIERFGVTEAMLLKAHRQITALHPELRNLDAIPTPYVGVHQDWSEWPFRGGWHSWNPRAKSWEVVEYLSQPFTEVPLFTCGEAFSTEQGWIEGALKSAEVALQKLGVPAPDIEGHLYHSVRSTGFQDYIHT